MRRRSARPRRDPDALSKRGFGDDHSFLFFFKGFCVLSSFAVDGHVRAADNELRNARLLMWKGPRVQLWAQPRRQRFLRTPTSLRETLRAERSPRNGTLGVARFKRVVWYPNSRATSKEEDTQS
jgi:hypothetical protein